MRDDSLAHFAVCFGDLCTAHLGNREQDADLERYLRREGERLRFVTRRHATSTPGLLAALRRGTEPAPPAATVAALKRAVRAYPSQWFNFFDRWSPARVAA